MFIWVIRVVTLVGSVGIVRVMSSRIINFFGVIRIIRVTRV